MSTLSRATVVAGLAALIAAGCGSSSTHNASTSTTKGGGTTGQVVTARLTEYHITLSPATLAPGPYVFKAVNAGAAVHALEITGPGLAAPRTKDLSPGGSADLSVTLQAGTYDVFCPVDSHKDLGMNVTLTVGGATNGTAGGAASTTPTTNSSSGY